jgi:transcriptional regulator with XRE-family HTH domain
MPVKALALVLSLWLLFHSLLPFQPDKLRKRRKALHLTQAELAEELGVDTRTVQKWETGEIKQPHLKHRLDVQRLLRETDYWDSDDTK